MPHRPKPIFHGRLPMEKSVWVTSSNIRNQARSFVRTLQQVRASSRRKPHQLRLADNSNFPGLLALLKTTVQLSGLQVASTEPITKQPEASRPKAVISLKYPTKPQGNLDFVLFF